MCVCSLYTRNPYLTDLCKYFKLFLSGKFREYSYNRIVPSIALDPIHHCEMECPYYVDQISSQSEVIVLYTDLAILTFLCVYKMSCIILTGLNSVTKSMIANPRKALFPILPDDYLFEPTALTTMIA